MIAGLGVVQFDLMGYRERLSRRPMSKSYALGLLRILFEYQDEISEDTFRRAESVAADIAADDDPISNATADEVQAIVLAQLGEQNAAGQALARNAEVWQGVAETTDALNPLNIIGGGAKKVVGDLGHGLGDLFANLLGDPKFWLVAGGAVAVYLLVKQQRPRAAV